MLPLVVLHTEVQAGPWVFVSLRRYSAWTGLWLCKTWMASSTLNHCLFLPVKMQRKHRKVGSQKRSGRRLYTYSRFYQLCWSCVGGASCPPILSVLQKDLETTNTEVHNQLLKHHRDGLFHLSGFAVKCHPSIAASSSTLFYICFIKHTRINVYSYFSLKFY